MISGLLRAWRAARLQTDLVDDAAFHKIGINRTDGRCLDALRDGPLTAAALAQACGVTANALTTVVDRLAGRGLVERANDPADRRRVVIRLTPLADHISQQLYGPVVRWSVESFEQYSTAELELIERFISAGTEFQVRHLDYLAELRLSWEVTEAPTDTRTQPGAADART